MAPPQGSLQYTSQPCKIVVGNTHFYIHQEILDKLAMFMLDLSADFDTTGEAVIDLHGIDVDGYDIAAVGRFVEFLYKGSYTIPDPKPEDGENNNAPTPPASTFSTPHDSPDRDSLSQNPDAAMSPRINSQDTAITSYTQKQRMGAPSHQPHKDCTNVLFCHAQVYIFAVRNDVEDLRSTPRSRFLNRMSEDGDGDGDGGGEGERVVRDTVALVRFLGVYAKDRADGLKMGIVKMAGAGAGRKSEGFVGDKQFQKVLVEDGGIC
ncbi:uncharacterized protein KY384_003477 [Bacidia gigantensis]|uniref:uncharacterized protein n=1 Tax=Bacidia gigantensis TaxID=2732470 RepID=UPI001D03E188|nr:uncharacterized protein KY384_003477 [Bacidia gigantensis]KAG8531841.1 hypothetical protein KY384_003477 [Bacidia gigantensis]